MCCHHSQLLPAVSLNRPYSDRGNAFLELLLFLPFGFFFLFIVVDTGLLFVERAGLRDSLRAVLHEETGLSQQYGIGAIGLGASDYSEEGLRSLASVLAERILLERSRNQIFSVAEVPVVVGVSIIEVEIDIDTGSQGASADSYQILAKETRSSGSVGYAPTLPSMEDFIAKTLTDDAGSPSQFAVSLGLAHNPLNPDHNTIRYLPRTLLVFAEISSEARGINPAYLRAVLGQAQYLHEQELIPLRTQLR